MATSFQIRKHVQTCTNTFTNFQKWYLNSLTLFGIWPSYQISQLSPLSQFWSNSHVKTCTNTSPTFQKWQYIWVWENGLVKIVSYNNINNEQYGRGRNRGE